MNTFKAIYLKQNSKKSIDDLAYLKLVESVRKNFDLSELTPVEPLLYSGTLKNLVNEFSEYKGTLVFSQFSAFEKDIKGLQILADSQLKFLFSDYQSLTSESIQAVIDIIKRGRIPAHSNEKIQYELSPKRDVGNASNKKTLNGLSNEKNLAARRFLKKKIAKLKETKERKEGIKIRDGAFNVSYSALAKALNEKGFKTARDKKFLPKSVERLINKSKEVDKNFEPSLEYKNQALAISRKNPDASGISGIMNMEEIDKEIKFQIKRKIIGPIEVRLENNIEEVFCKEYDEGTKSIVIDIDEHYFLPGKYYLTVFFTDADKNVKALPILLRKNLKV